MSDSVASIYLDGTYAGKNNLFGDDNAAWKAANVHAMMTRRSHLPTRLCELGCGGGGILLELQKLRPEVLEIHGYEPMPEAYEVCKSRQNETLKFFNQTLGPDFQGVRYHAMLMFDVFEHIEDYLGFLRGVRHVADCVYFHIPLDMSVQMVARAKPLKILRDNVGHLHYFSKDTALETLKHSGYEILDWCYTDGSTSSYKTLKYQLMKWPRKLLYALSPDLAVRFLGGYSLLVAAKSKS